MPTHSEIRSWTRQPISKWFFEQLTLRYGNIDTEWRGVTSLDDLNKNKGKAEVLDLITQLITEPQLFDPVTPQEE